MEYFQLAILETCILVQELGQKFLCKTLQTDILKVSKLLKCSLRRMLQTRLSCCGFFVSLFLSLFLSFFLLISFILVVSIELFSSQIVRFRTMEYICSLFVSSQFVKKVTMENEISISLGGTIILLALFPQRYV